MNLCKYNMLAADKLKLFIMQKVSKKPSIFV